jgi:SAM-dependent methyltransferase
MKKETEINVKLFDRFLREGAKSARYGEIGDFYPGFHKIIEDSFCYEKERYRLQMELKKLSNQQKKPHARIDREEYRLFDAFFQKLRQGDPLYFKDAIHHIAPLEIRKIVNSVYREFRKKAVLEALASKCVSWESVLSSNSSFGCGVDERIVEIPLALEVACLDQHLKILDAGSAFNLDYLKEFLKTAKAKFIHYTLNSDKEPPFFEKDKYSYCFGDLREIDFKNEIFDRVFCISTIEHIGMDNLRYGAGCENRDKNSYDRAVQEMFRVLKKGGQMMLSFPFGGNESKDCGWFRVFDWNDVNRIMRGISPTACREKYFVYQRCWFEVDKKDFDQVAQQGISSALAVLLFTK